MPKKMQGCRCKAADKTVVTEAEDVQPSAAQQWKEAEERIELEKRNIAHAEEVLRRNVVYCKARCTDADTRHVPGCQWYDPWSSYRIPRF